jgi:hypothetical protein
MITTITSYVGQLFNEDDPEWVTWATAGFLALNVLLLVAVVSVWRHRQPASPASVGDEAAPIVSSADFVTEAELMFPAPITSAADAEKALFTPGVEPAQAPVAVMPFTSTPRIDVQLASAAIENELEAMNEVKVTPISLPHMDEMSTVRIATVAGADLDTDGDVDIFDIVRYASNPDRADVNRDGLSDIRDLIALDANYGSVVID